MGTHVPIGASLLVKKLPTEKNNCKTNSALALLRI